MKRWPSVGAIVLVLLTACASRGGAGPTAQERDIESVSTQKIKAEPTPPSSTDLLTQQPRVETDGTCAPRYSTGRWGTCVNGKVCRGFGVRTHNGSVECSCFGDSGGCREGERCDEKLLACVPDEEPDEGRSR